MTNEDFRNLVQLVLESRRKPPEALFAQGFDDWHARARLAHFLAMPEIGRPEEASELFHSAIDAETDEENREDVEEKIFALQRLSEIERAEKRYEEALEHINAAIECAESTDFLYKYILRGELWADRWNLMHKLRMTEEAEAETDERIAAFEGLEDAVPHNSYLYYGYRFKAHLAAERGVVLIAKDYMHMAIHAMEIPPAYEQGLTEAFAATHENAPWILREIDRATPNPEQLHWDI